MFQFRILSVLFLFFISLTLNAQTEPSAAEKQSMSDKISQMAGMLGGDVKYADSYAFDHMMKMEMTATQKGGKKSSQSVMVVRSGDDGKVMCMEVLALDGKEQKDKTMMLYDIPNSTMVTLQEDSKGTRSGMAMGFDANAMQNLIDDQVTDETTNENATFRKTGNTKTILGYKCDEYAFDTDDAEGTAWAAEDADVNTFTFFGLMGQNVAAKQKNNAGVLSGYPQGLLLEMNSRDKKSNDTVTMVVTDLKLNSVSSLKTSDYNVMSLGGMMGR